MSKITVMPKTLSELIAAGEVCERPSSVVKELLENSIDAHSTKITVEIINGGNTYIRITDDGSGIEREDVPTAFLSHATSKISKSEDLDSIMTLGFRGEALASVAAVAKIELLTKSAASEFGTRYLISGGEEISLDDAGCPQGTTIIVRDLFYNTPARMKFLKKDVTEGNYISDILTKTALAHPDISFRLIKNDKEALFTSGNGSLADTVSSLFGKDFASGLTECNYELNGVHVSGLLSKPINSRPNRNMQFFYVNSRYVRLPFASAALDQAYKNSLMTGKFPGAVLFLSVPPETVDVNVHPAKTEVRFADEKRTFEAIYYCAKNALSLDTTRPELNLDERRQIKSYNEFLSSHFKNEPKPQQTFLNLSASEFREKQSLSPTCPPQPKPITEKQATLSSEKTYQPQVLNDTTSTYGTNDDKIEITYKPQIVPSSEINSEFQAKANAAAVFIEELVEENVQTIDNAKNEQPPSFVVLGEAFKTYIIVESENKLLLIDKHAAHERMIFNTLKKQERQAFSQMLLSPANITLSKKEYAALIENLELVNQAGFILEDFGEGSVRVRETPFELTGEDVSSLICEIAGYLCSHTRDLTADKLDNLYHITACHSALRAGKKTEKYELCDFVGKILRDDDIRFCPHGRPVIIELTRHELEKQFGRIQ